MKYPEDFINKIICSDNLDILKLIPDNSVHLILTDPPYNISSDLKIFMRDHRDSPAERILSYDYGKWDHFENEDEFLAFTYTWMKECYRILTPEGNFVTFFDNWLTGDIKKIWEKLGGRARQKVYWIKTNPKPRLRKVDFQQGVEELFWGAKSSNKHIFNYNLGQHTNYIHSAVHYNDETTGHPNQKPERTVDWIIEYLSNPDNIILDPFCGSGTIPYIAKKLGRNFIAIDSSPEYCKIATNRIQPNIISIKVDYDMFL